MAAKDPKKNGPSAQDQAMQYGWDLATLKSIPEVYSLFQKAIKEDWTEQKFALEVRKTKWFRQNSETIRQAIALKGTDPAQYQRLVERKKAEIQTIANQLGVPITNRTLNKWATDALHLGWNDVEIRNTIANTLASNQAGTDLTQAQVINRQAGFGGQVAEILTTIREMYADYGVQVSDATIEGYIPGIVSGKVTVEGVRQQIINKYAKQLFPAWADELDQGRTVREIADPYIQMMARTLELNPADVNLFDPTIKQALQAVGQDGKPASKPLWQFELDLRKDARWTKTKGAQDELMQAGQAVLRDWGLVA